MPEKFAGILAGAMFADVLIAAAGAFAVVDTPVMDKHDLRAYCVIGSAIGSFLAVALFTPVSDNTANVIRRLAVKFFSSLSCGIIFTPIAIRYCGLPHDVDFVLAISAITALIAVSVLHKVIPIIEAAWVKKTSQAVGVSEPTQ